jgi:hypothetical protein
MNQRRSRVLTLALCVFASTFILSAIGYGAEASLPTTPTSAPATTTDSFSGSLTHSGSVTYSFTVAETGGVEVSLTSVDPLATLALGVDVGSWAGSACGTFCASTTNARRGLVALGGTAAAGTYCLRVYDPGNIPESYTVNFAIQVVHP